MQVLIICDLVISSLTLKLLEFEITNRKNLVENVTNKFVTFKMKLKNHLGIKNKGILCLTLKQQTYFFFLLNYIQFQ